MGMRLNNKEESAAGTENALTGTQRRKKILALMRQTSHPLSGGALGRETGVSRQVVVQDLGGCVLDVMINHRVYGKVTAPLNIKNRRDIQIFMNDIESGKSAPLMNVTSGYHFHRVSAEQEEILDEIEEALREKHYLTELMPYEEM